MTGKDSTARADAATVDPLLDSQGRSAANPSYRSQLGRFVILYQLGAGGMGTVFAAYDEQLDRKVAIKLLHSQTTPRERQHQRTLREAKALARVTHPRVVSVYEVGEAGDQVYLAMEFVDGIALRQWQSQRPRSWRELLRMYLQAGEGLQAAHESGVVHRDFKPDNVLVGRDGLPRVADFGIARLDTSHVAEGDDGSPANRSPVERVTTEGALVGTIGYMSPENITLQLSDGDL